MKKYTSILFIFLYSFALAQDVYPNFSSPQKQFKFEKKRIYIDEVEEKEQIIEGGGSEFNVLALYNNVLPAHLQQPTLRQGNISTRYAYRYSFEITQNNKQLNEVDLLYAVGLKDEADDIIREHERQLKNFDKKHNKKKIKKKSYLPVYAGGFLALTGLAIYANDANESNMVLKLERLQHHKGGSIFYFSLLFSAISWLKISGDNKKLTKTPSPPVLQQTMSSKQLTAIAESYNRQVYKQIQSSY